MKNYLIGAGAIFLIIIIFLGVKFFSEESQNRLSRSLQTTMGIKEGKVEVFIGQSKPVKTIFRVEKLSPVLDSDGDVIKSYGYGYIDRNYNGVLDKEELDIGKKYFELPNYSQYFYWDASK